MGKKAQALKKQTERAIRAAPLTTEEHELLRSARYEGSPSHKRNPGDFGLTPPASPRLDKTLCDEAGITSKAVATGLFKQGIERGLVSDGTTPGGFPKQFWVVDEAGRAFEAMYGGSQTGCYHGYPIRESDPFIGVVRKAWKR